MLPSGQMFLWLRTLAKTNVMNGMRRPLCPREAGALPRFPWGLSDIRCSDTPVLMHVPVSTSSHMHSFPWCCWWFSKFISSVDYLSWVCRSQNAEFIYLECFHWLLLRHSFLPPPTLLSAPRSSSRKSLLCSSVRCVCVTFGEGGENILDSIYI